MDLQRIHLGQQLTWLYTPRGGYGYSYPVDAEVLSVGAKRVKVRVQKKSGKFVERWVAPGSLQERKRAR